ncbi:MAG: hypothetical protein WCT05_05385, partial [Lentisphaeria bacterium]
AYGNSGQTGRNAFDNAEASYLFTIPMKQYSTAWILCACESDSEKYPLFTARLTRYVPSGQMGGRAYSALGDVHCEVREKSAVQVGTVTVNGKTLPLWRVEARLDLGKVIDLITDPFGTWGRGAFKMHYLDFELMGWNPLYRTPFGDPRVYPDPDKPSSVHVFGVTLERSPVDVRFLQTTPSKNMFDDTMKPEMRVEYARNRPGDYALEWMIRNGFGRKAGKGCFSLKDEHGGKTIDLSQKDLGWYQIVFKVVDRKSKKVVVEHTASYALMGKDTRRAGYDSPYIGWAFGYAHYGDGDLDLNGLRSRMLGVRRLTGLSSYTGHSHTEKDYEKYQLTTFNACRYFSGTTKKTNAEIKAATEELLQKWPHAKYVPLFWENTAPYGPYQQAPELYGESVPNRDEEWLKKADERWEVVLRCQRVMKDFPQLRVLLGNSLTSSELIAETLRKKPPQDLIYAIGTEAIQRTAHPEKPLIPFTMMYSRQMIDVAKMLGYELKVTCGPENIARKADTIGLFRHAEWLVRDMLVQHIFGFETIAGANAGGGVGNCYDASFYAGGPGRAPYLYPNPSASATGTLTKVLDCVEFVKLVPTGSNTVYCAEFYRAYDRKSIYAFWTSRGTAELTIKTASNDIEQVGFYGRRHRPWLWFKTCRLTASTAAQYLLSDAKIQSVRMGRRIYSEDMMPAEFQIIEPVDSGANWKNICQAEPLIEGSERNRMFRKLAACSELSEVVDPEKGKCLELRIDSDKTLNPQFSEYMIIRPEKPVLITGDVNTVGLWVKGNSGWGQIFWELEDAAGIRRISSSTPVHGGNVFDYEGRLSIDFDSWCFLSVQVTTKSPIREISTGAVMNIWAGPMSEPKMPMKLTGIVFCAPAYPLCLNEYRECEQTIRIKDAAALVTPRKTTE